MNSRQRFLLLSFLFAGICQPVFAQNDIALYDELSDFTRKITTTVPEAQAYFNQGLQLAYAFGRGEAVKSFRMAQKQDPSCSMCYWGEAWALGPYINGRMDSTAGVEAYRAIQEALKRYEYLTDLELALVRAMALRYEAVPDEDRRAHLDSVYVDAMREVMLDYPRDLDVASLVGEAIMVLSPWDHWYATGQPKPGTDEALGVLEGVLGRDIGHPGACHLYIHLVEASTNPALGEACADHLADGIPGASHIQHMPSHIYMHIAGRYGDAVRANQRAWQVDQMASVRRGASIYPRHNIHMLVYASWMDGQSAVSLQAAQELADFSSNDAFYPLLIQARFGKWDRILREEEPEDNMFHSGMWALAQGLAELRTNGVDAAEKYVTRLEKIIKETPEENTYGSSGHSQVDLLTIAHALLKGEVLAEEGKVDAFIPLLENAIAIEDALAYDEPEPWPLPARQFLGALLVQAGRFEQAEQVYMADLEDYPENGWSLYGLMQALEGSGKNEEAEQVRHRFEEAWQRADIWLNSSRF